jgi:hypothetical protein
VPDRKYVSVRRPVDAPFRVLTGDLVSEPPTGYDLSLISSMAREGLTSSISVLPLANGRFAVVDGKTRLAVIRHLIRANHLVYDAVRGILRPAKRVFAFLRCRISGSRPRRRDVAGEPKSDSRPKGVMSDGRP